MLNCFPHLWCLAHPALVRIASVAGISFADLRGHFGPHHGRWPTTANPVDSTLRVCGSKTISGFGRESSPTLYIGFRRGRFEAQPSRYIKPPGTASMRPRPIFRPATSGSDRSSSHVIGIGTRLASLCAKALVGDELVALKDSPAADTVRCFDNGSTLRAPASARPMSGFALLSATPWCVGRASATRGSALFPA